MARYDYQLDIFEKETKRFIRLFFYKKKLRRARIVAAATMIPLIILGSSQLVKADLFYFYSPLCLGSWANVQNVEGEPQVPQGGSANDFDNSNSAILKNSGGQIFCGKFESSNLPEGNMREVSVRLSLAVQEDKPVQFVPQDWDNGNILDSEIEQSGTFIIPEPELPKAESEVETSPEMPAIEPESSSSPELQQEIPKVIIPSPEPESSIQSEPSSSLFIPSEVSPRFFGRALLARARLLTGSNTTHAQEVPQEAPSEVPLNLDDLLSVRYTLDGETWDELGRITLSNWNNPSFKVPISSLDQVSQLQIGLMSLPTIYNAVSIYLDSIWLEAEYDSGFVSFVKDTSETIFETVTLRNFTDDAEMVPFPEPKETRPVKIKEYNFNVGRSEKVDGVLKWYTREDIQKLDKFLNNKKARNIEVSTKDGSQNLVISGSCQDKFYVVLLYRNREDYSKNPSSAVYNSAFECTGTINHRLETENLIGGNYWLLIGEQRDTGTWVPISDLREISLEVKEVEIQQ